MKIGIGVSTTSKRTISENYKKWSNPDAIFEVYSDDNREGVARSRNLLLSRLKDCDHVFLFDDDCYPVMSGWEDYYISTCQEFGVQKSSLPETFKSNLLGVDKEMGRWDSCIGCFTYLSKTALETLGGFSTSYKGYGYEDHEYHVRAYYAGLTGGFYNSCPIRAISYIHSQDVFSENPIPNYSFDEKSEFIRKNHSTYAKEIESGVIWRPLE